MALRRCMDGVRGMPHPAHSDCTNRRRTTTNVCLYCVVCALYLESFLEALCIVSDASRFALPRGRSHAPAARFKKEP